ncbi:MAG TPA: transglycosylase SLT domain-containing protein [Candidatus Angelobacter sp.]|nr:transglycosylase SLT domain-containing protein [Candidatus Angelobacter sp.]
MVARRTFIILALIAVLFSSAASFGQTHTKKTQPKKKTVHQTSAQTLRKLHHIRRAFVASADLKPMAQQLLAERTPQAYAGVQEYAHRHRKDDAAPLAWLVLGYAHYLDKDYVKAREAWAHSDSLAPILGDYLEYLRASAYQGEGNQQEVVKTLQGFDEKYPDSLNLHDANLLYANALIGTGKPEQAIAYLEKHRAPASPDTEFALASAYQAEGMKVQAADTLRRIYFEMPVSDQAALAASMLQSMGEPQPAGSFDQRHTRTELLMKSRRYQDAANELSLLIEQAPPEKLSTLQAEFATALYRSRRRDDAQRLFEAILQGQNSTVDAKAQALYFLAEISRDKDDKDKHGDYVSQLRTLAPDSNWLQEALLSAGNMYMLKNDFDTGSKFYAEIFQRQPKGRFSPYAHWKTAWLTYRTGKKEEAARLFDEQLELYPASAEVPAALYWRGRLAEEEGNQPVARAYYQKLSENYRFFYYANLGRDRLVKLGFENIGDPAVLDKLPPLAALPRDWEPPQDNVRIQKAQLLANGALYDFAVKEVQAASPGSPPWEAKLLADVYADQGSYIHAIEALKRAVPAYFSAELSQIPRPVWEGLFPRPFWEDLRKNALINHLDPYVVASLIRQESEFNPLAISRANAMGLMQLLPNVGKGVAREMRIHHFSSDNLLVANTNLQLGTRYFKHMVDHYDGQVEYALAAYNAGEDRVDEWRKNGNFHDVQEFVESIPFTETREYVQAIMRNAVLYKLLYPKG